MAKAEAENLKTIHLGFRPEDLTLTGDTGGIPVDGQPRRRARRGRVRLRRGHPPRRHDEGGHPPHRRPHPAAARGHRARRHQGRQRARLLHGDGPAPQLSPSDGRPSAASQPHQGPLCGWNARWQLSVSLLALRSDACPGTDRDAMPLHVTAALDDPDLLFLPWQTPLEEWPADQLVALPRGISRHVVRFVRLHGVVYRGEGGRRAARRPASTSCSARSSGWTCRRSRRSASSPAGRPRTATRSTRRSSPGTCSSRCPTGRCSHPRCALTRRTGCSTRSSLLLVRLHLAGFAWDDCSLSNTLFRRDAGAFAAYLVDAETGDLHPRLSDGQRENDIEVARINIFGELSDLEAGGMLHESIDAAAHRRRHRRAATAGCGTSSPEPLQIKEGERYLVDAPHPPAQRPRLRRRRGPCRPATPAHQRTRPAEGRRRGPPHPAADAADRPRRPRRTRPAGCSTTSTPTGPRWPSRRATRESPRTAG